MAAIHTDLLSSERPKLESGAFIGADQARLQATLAGIRDDLDAQRRAGRTLYYCGTSGMMRASCSCTRLRVAVSSIVFFRMVAERSCANSSRDG